MDETDVGVLVCLCLLLLLYYLYVVGLFLNDDDGSAVCSLQVKSLFKQE
jgi:hypothetical protein